MSALAGVMPSARAAEVAAIVVACAALASRTVSNEALLVLPLVALVGVVVEAAPARRMSSARWLGVTAAGTLLFAVGRSFGVAAGVPLGAVAVASLVLAAVAEELLFRRGMWALVERSSGPVAAAALTAVAFALVHVPIYGLQTLPLNLAAGLVLGWQRHASRSWTAPALTHALANLMQGSWL